MTGIMHTKQVNDLLVAATAFSASSGTALSVEVEKNSALLMLWLSYLKSYKLTGTADELVFAVESSIRETAASFSLGLVRPALFSLRTEIDLILAWIYFKDHTVEWNHVNSTGDGFKSKKEVLDYLAAHHPRFVPRLNIFKEIKTRSEKEPYRTLSAHIHGQSNAVLPAVSELSDLVQSADFCIASSKMAFEVTEYINDVLLSIYLPNWHALPKDICSAAEKRFVSPAQRADCFK